MRVIFTTLATFVLLLAPPAFTQQTGGTPSSEADSDPELVQLRQKANSPEATGIDWAALGQKYLSRSRFDDASAAFLKYTKMNPEAANAWSLLGLSYHLGGKYDEAIDAYISGEKISAFPQMMQYNLACAYSLKGDVDESIVWLDKALESGFSDVNLLNSDTDLNNVRSDPRFSDFTTRADRNARPCEYNENCRQLDFWVGIWDVFTPAGFLAGRNVIELDYNGCVVRESWTSSTSGFRGESLNYYDAATGDWKQRWVDGSGGIIEMVGKLEDGAMRFEGTATNRDGQIELTRMSLTPNKDGSVHQFIERSKDSGKTWLIYFDGKYMKAKGQ